MKMINIKEIARGFINVTKAELGIATNVVEDRAIERYSICLTCPILSDSKSRCDSKKGGCGCLLQLKTRSDSKCPIGNW